MKIKTGCFIFIFLILSAHLFALGRAQVQSQENQALQNNEWIFCITDFDVSSLPPGKTNISALVSRKMVERLDMINYRTRISSEYAYYEEHAWTRERSAAARQLAAKLEERSQILFKGESNWNYRRNIARIDADIEKLRAALETIENNAPLINNEPVFRLNQNNLNLMFPAAPSPGEEFRFCTTQRIDAFLSGSISDFHGRYLLSIKLYTVYTRTFVLQDNIVFSHEDLENAIDEIVRRLVIMLSGNRPAAVEINAQPAETLVLINRSFAGRGETNIIEFPPGIVTVTATAPNHDSISFETELNSGELAKINIRLNEIEYGNIEVMGNEGDRVYNGALYVGEAPLTLRLPINSLEYIELETQDMQKGTVVFQTPDYADFSQTIPIRTSVPLQRGRVDKERNAYYWAWGTLWLSGITAFISYQTLLGLDGAMFVSGGYNQNMNDSLETWSIVFDVSLITAGVIGAYSIYRLIRYLHTANTGTAPARVTGRN